MSIDLERSLDDLARSVHDEALAERMNGQVYRMVAQIRRRRATRYTTTSVVGMGAAAAVVIGGMQLAGRDEGTVPVATNGPDTAPSPWPGCGEPAPTAGTGAGGLELTATTDELVSYGTQPYAAIHVTNDSGVTWSDLGDTSAVVVADGVVVGTATAANLGEAPLDVVACAGDTPLSAGDYELYASASIDVAGVGTVELRSAAEPFTITDAGSMSFGGSDADRQAALDDLLAGAAGSTEMFGVCGSALPSDAQDAVLSLTLEVPNPDQPAGAWFTSPVTVRTTGGRTVTATVPAAGAVVVLVRDGVVVGRGTLEESGTTPLTIGPNDAPLLPGVTMLSLCSLPGADAPELDLPAGTYQAYAVLDATITDVTESDGTTATPGLAVTLRSEPVEVTLT